MELVSRTQISLSSMMSVCIAPPHSLRNMRQPLVRLRRPYGSLNLMLTLASVTPSLDD